MNLIANGDGQHSVERSLRRSVTLRYIVRRRWRQKPFCVTSATSNNPGVIKSGTQSCGYAAAQCGEVHLTDKYFPTFGGYASFAAAQPQEFEGTPPGQA